MEATAWHAMPSPTSDVVKVNTYRYEFAVKRVTTLPKLAPSAWSCCSNKNSEADEVLRIAETDSRRSRTHLRHESPSSHPETFVTGRPACADHYAFRQTPPTTGRVVLKPSRADRGTGHQNRIEHLQVRFSCPCATFDIQPQTQAPPP
jgi:hypothetical protein